MSKKILLLFALILTSLNFNAQQCQNLDITNTVATCAFPTTTLEASFLNLGYKTTQTYLVNGLTVCPPQQAQPTSANISPDDAWAPIIFNLGFNFCFYGNTYDQIVISGNGVLSFDIEEVQDYLITNPNGPGPFHVWNTNANLDLPDINLAPNAIFGPYTDPNPANAAIPTETIKFDLINQNDPGNRVFVVEYDVPMFSCSTEFLHSRIKLYESSNVIDVEILEKGRCDNWENSTGIVGIQNKSATLATVVPGRTNADGGWWVNGDPAHGGNIAEQELWRFVPDGNDLGYEFKWFADYGQGAGYEELFPNQMVDDAIIEVNPQIQTTYEARLTYQTECSFEQFTLSEAVLIDAPLQDNVQEPVDLTLCESSFQSGTADFDLDQFDTILSEYINSTLLTWDMNDFTVTYHESEDDRDNNVIINPIDTYNASDNTTIYVRIVFDDGTISCFDIFNEFTLNVTPLDDASISYPQSIYCTIDNNPTPTATTSGGTYTIDNGGVINPTTGEVDIVASGTGTDGLGIFEITYETPAPQLGLDCSNSDTTTISIEITNDADFTYPATACLGDVTNPTPITFNTGGNFFINNGGVIDTATGEVDLSLTTVGDYEITYSFNTGGNCPSSDMQPITIYAEDDATFSYPNNAYCNDDSDPMPTATTSGGTYTINNGGVINTTTGIVDLSTSNLGTDLTGVFTIEYTTNGNCPNSTEFNISIELREDAGFSFPTDICHYESNPQAFDIVTSGGTYMVDNGASIDSNGILDLSTTTAGTTYEITYGFVTGLCQSTTSQFITVHTSPIASAPTTMVTECNNGDGTANFNISGLENEILGSQSNVTLTYHPSFDDAENNTSEINTQPHARVNGNIWARVENSNGCFSIVEVYLTVENCYIVLPQGFSPSSNNVENQTFDVRNLRANYPKFKLFIYNRYGKLVYEGDASKENWNGKLDNEGDILPAGTYFYGIKLNEEQELTNKGWVYLQQ